MGPPQKKEKRKILMPAEYKKHQWLVGEMSAQKQTLPQLKTHRLTEREIKRQKVREETETRRKRKGGKKRRTKVKQSSDFKVSFYPICLEF